MAGSACIRRDDISKLFLDFKKNCDECNLNEDEIYEIYDETFCPSCGNEEALIIQEGCYECRFCGIKQDIKLNMEQEWRYYGDSDTKGNDPNRVGMPTNSLLPESSLGSIIGIKGGDFSKLRQYHQYNIFQLK